MNPAFSKSFCLGLLALACAGASASEDGSFDLITTDYHTDKNHDVVFLGASAYLGLDRILQEKISVQLISQDYAADETEFFWAFASSGRLSPARSLSPFIGIGFSLGESYVCEEEPEDDATVHVYHDGEEVCIEDTLFTSYGEYGIYWLLNNRVFLEVSARRNYTSKKQPFDSTVRGFSFGFRY